MPSISVVIITLNEEKNIRRCLESVKDIADEIVVVDSLSTDQTKNICLEFGAKFIEQPFLGYIEQKNFALNQAGNDYVFSLDADEAADEILRNKIKILKQHPFEFDGYSMNRCTNYCGKWIRHGTWYPDTKLRLINRKKSKWAGTNPHDKIEMEKGTRIKHLPGDILHYTYYTIEEHIAQMNKFTSIQAKAMYEQGKKSSVLKLIVNPAFAFVSGYLLKGGFLDGSKGLIIARTVAYQTFLKYAKLLQLNKAANR
ncbi:MAG: glycosyltransferase family 2 protein [Bacteroidetes bacterium]|nr:MAG: glycosyltransferase family 2 protein [Bacteroidota bacterium]